MAEVKSRCPHCNGALLRIRTKVHTPLMKVVTLACQAPECEAVLQMAQQIFRTVKESHNPNPDVSEQLK